MGEFCRLFGCQRAQHSFYALCYEHLNPLWRIDDHESEVMPASLWRVLRRVGFVDGEWKAAPAEARARVEQLAEALHAELVESERVRFVPIREQLAKRRGR